MARKNAKNQTLHDLVVKEMGKKAWADLSSTDKKVVRELSKIENSGGPAGSAVTKEHKRPDES